MKRLLLAGIASVLFACGGSSGAPPLRSFSYGTPTTPSTEQQATASTAQSSLQGIVGVGGQTSNPSSAPTLTDDLANQLPSTGTAVLAPLPAPAQQFASQDGALRAMRSAGLTVGSQCVSQTPTSITYTNCTYNSDGFNGTLNGTINTASSQQISWDISWTIAGSSQGVTLSGSFKWSGQLAWTTTTIKGFGRSEYVVNGSANGQSYDLASTAGFDVDVTYLPASPYCVATGTLEVRRVVSGSSASQAGMKDGAWKFTWSGDGSTCGTVTVASGR